MASNLVFKDGEIGNGANLARERFETIVRTLFRGLVAWSPVAQVLTDEIEQLLAA